MIRPAFPGCHVRRNATNRPHPGTARGLPRMTPRLRRRPASGRDGRPWEGEMSTSKTVGQLVIIGGGEEQEGAMDVLREFVRLAGGPEEARIVVMSAASRDHEAQDAKYREA